MSIPAATKNAMLSALAVDKVSLHTGFPGAIGSNEVTGGTYAQQTVTFSSPAGGVKAMTSAVTFSGLPVCTIRWVGFWAGTTFIACAPNGGAVPKNFIAIHSSDLIYSAAHNFADGQKVVFFSGTPPGGLVEGQVYYVRDSFTDSFKVAATLGGEAVNLTSAASAGCWLSAITEDVYGVAGASHQLSAASLVVPD
jgi:hypothetical protein